MMDMSSSHTFLPLDKPEEVNAWLISFEAMCRSKKIIDELKKTDKFLEQCGSKALLKVLSLMPGVNIEKQQFCDIKAKITQYVEPSQRLVIADRTNFLLLKQETNEAELDYLSRLNEASTHCKWEELKSLDPSSEIIKLRFIAGLKDDNLKMKILERVQLNPSLTMSDIIDLCQINAQLKDFVETKNKESDEPSKPTETFSSQVVNSRPCSKCGFTHKFKMCPAYGKTCNSCGKPNHFAKCCKSRRDGRKKETNTKMTHNVDVFHVQSCSKKGNFIELSTHGTTLSFQIDSGAEISLMSEVQWKDIGSPILQNSKFVPINFDGTKMITLGKAEIHFDEVERPLQFLVVRSNRQHGLIGRDLIDATQSTLTTTFSSSSEFLPPINGFKASMALAPDSAPLKFIKARKVPIHIKEQLDEELARLEEMGVIEQLSFSDHASPVVWVKKANGTYRMCVDFKATVNEKLQSDAYPIPSVEEIFAKIGKSVLFAKIDLKSAYWQIELDEPSKKLSVINTHKGLFQVNRLQMGMKNSSAIFQRCMESILKNIEGVIIYQDDILVCAESKRQLKKRLGLIFQRLQEQSVTLNKEKCVTETDSLRFLGFLITKDGIKPDPALTEKILKAESPKTQKELSSLLGLFTFYGRFVKDFAQLCAPLHDAKHEDQFKWSDECEDNFQILKERLTSSPVLQPYVPTKTSVVTVDASLNAIGAVLSQDGHPVLFVSRKLTETERRYSNIEREALAVVWACTRLQQFLLGKRFVIETDHKPLIYILGDNHPVKTDISPRLMNLSIKVMRFDFEIRHVKGTSNVVADALSRVLYDDDDDVSLPQVNFSRPGLDVSVLAQETLNDQFLCDIKKRIIQGDWSSSSSREKPYKKIAWELTIDDDGLIRRGSKIVPPLALHDQIFKTAHQSHCGTLATSRLVEREFWWPQMKMYIERRVRACESCRNSRFRSCNTTHTWPKDDKPWTRLHMDWAQARGIGNILVVVDTFSGWLEAAICHDRKLETVVDHLRAIFARFGVPHLMVTDNAPEFAGGDLRAWMMGIGCRLAHSPEYHPQANGSAERMVRVIKDALKCFNPHKSSIQAYIQRVLFVHRNTAQREGKTPAEWLLGRNVRCPIANGIAPMEEILYRKNAEQSPIKVRYLYNKGTTTSVVARPDNRTMLAHDSQLSVSQRQVESENESEEEEELAGDSSFQRRQRSRAPTKFFGDMVMY